MYLLHYISPMSYRAYLLSATASLLTATVLAMSAAGAMAETKNYAGLSLSSVGGTTAFGINSRVGVAENISVRPYIQFASESVSGINITAALYGVSATYDFKLPKSELTPYVGVGFQSASVSGTSGGVTGTLTAGTSTYFEGGVDYAVSDSIVLNANYKSSYVSNSGGYFTVGAGYNF
jgi:hypothetical protein